MVLRGEPKLRFKFHTKASSRIRRRACLGKPRSDDRWKANWWTKSWWEDQGGHGMTKSYCVCDGEASTHSVSHAHFSDTVSLRDIQTSRTRMAQDVLQCACHISPSHPLHSHVSSAVLAVPAQSLRDHVPVCTVFVELYPTRKRGSSALPHERRGVWLLGRSRALHRL